MAKETIGIGELSRQTGCNIETIRYYERVGLTPQADRRNRYRCYAMGDVRRLRFIRRARELGFTLEEIRALLGIAVEGAVSCAEARVIAASHLASIRARLADLQRMERVLDEGVRACDASDQIGCPMIDTLSAQMS